MLEPGAHPVRAPQALAFGHERLDRHPPGGAAEPIAGAPGAEGSAGGVRLEEVGGEPLERVEPVVVAGDGVDRLVKALERQVELALVVPHGAGGIDHVGSDHQKLHVGSTALVQVAIAERMLGGIAFPGIADDQKAEVGLPADAFGPDHEQLLRGPATLRRDGLDHALPPRVHAGLGELLPDTGHPVLAVEIPAEAPDRVDGDQDCRDGQPVLERSPHRPAERRARLVLPHREADPTVQPEIHEPIADGGPRADAAPRQAVPPRARLQWPRELSPEESRGQEDHDRQHESRQQVADNGDGGRGEPEDVPGQIHPAGVRQEEDHGQGGAPGQVDAPAVTPWSSAARATRPISGCGVSTTRRSGCRSSGTHAPTPEPASPGAISIRQPAEITRMPRRSPTATTPKGRPEAPQEHTQGDVQGPVECGPRARGTAVATSLHEAPQAVGHEQRGQEPHDGIQRQRGKHEQEQARHDRDRRPRCSYRLPPRRRARARRGAARARPRRARRVRAGRWTTRRPPTGR